ncbi:MAG: hypothetical protein Q9160_009359 [Pyrenula sp. 1 TL-2023]
MSGTQIPNLNTLRRGGARGGRGSFARPRPIPQYPPESDVNDPSLPARFSTNEFRAPQRKLSIGANAAIAGTDLEAARSRLEIQKLGYIQDDFVRYFTPDTPQSPSTFLEAYDPRDTKYFRWLKKLAAKSSTRSFDLRYHEVDIERVTQLKIARVESSAFRKGLQNLTSIELRGETVDGSNFHSPDGYHIHTFDLKGLPNSVQGAKLKDTFVSMDENVPTLILSELCLMYLETQQADSVLRWFLGAFPESTPVGLIILEPIKPSDTLGRQMAQRMAEQNIHFTTIEAYPELIDQMQRLTTLGLVSNERHIGASSAIDWWSIWNKWLSEAERRRVEALEEPLDEIEYLKELFQHYCLAWGFRDGSNREGESPFSGWFD